MVATICSWAEMRLHAAQNPSCRMLFLGLFGAVGSAMRPQTWVFPRPSRVRMLVIALPAEWLKGFSWSRQGRVRSDRKQEINPSIQRSTSCRAHRGARKERRRQMPACSEAGSLKAGVRIGDIWQSDRSTRRRFRRHRNQGRLAVGCGLSLSRIVVPQRSSK